MLSMAPAPRGLPTVDVSLNTVANGVETRPRGHVGSGQAGTGQCNTEVARRETMSRVGDWE